MEKLLQNNFVSIFDMEIPPPLLSLLYTESAHTELREDQIPKSQNEQVTFFFSPWALV